VHVGVLLHKAPQCLLQQVAGGLHDRQRLGRGRHTCKEATAASGRGGVGCCNNIPSMGMIAACEGFDTCTLQGVCSVCIQHGRQGNGCCSAKTGIRAPLDNPQQGKEHGRTPWPGLGLFDVYNSGNTLRIMGSN
jgi:hypothetical protein